MATPPTYVATRLFVPRESGGSMSAWIVPLDPTHLTAFDAEWLPRLREMNQFDVSWDWRDWLRRSAGNPELELYALVTANSWSSAAISRLLSRPPRRQRVDGLCCLRGGLASELAPGSSLMYLELLAVAPWNRPEHKPKRELRCGPTMMAHVIQRSIAIGSGDAWACIHSEIHTLTPLTVGGDDGMWNGPRGQRRAIFEFAADAAARFLSRTT